MGTVGPFRLKQPLILVCLVEGGNPKPDVFWYRDNILFDQELDPSTYEDVLQNTLVISELDRSFQVDMQFGLIIFLFYSGDM